MNLHERQRQLLDFTAKLNAHASEILGGADPPDEWEEWTEDFIAAWDYHLPDGTLLAHVERNPAGPGWMADYFLPWCSSGSSVTRQFSTLAAAKRFIQADPEFIRTGRRSRTVG